MNRKTKVLEIFGEPISHGGQESFVINILQYLDHEKLDIDLLTPYYCDNTYYEDIVHSYNGNIYTFGLAFEPGKSRFNISEKIDRFFREHLYDVVHIHSGSISVLAIMSKYAKKNGIKKIIVHSHCAAEKKSLKYRLTKLAFSPMMNSNPTNYCACSMVAGEWKFSKHVVQSSLKILKNGVDLEKYSFNPEIRVCMRKKLGIPENAFVVGHVGRFSYQKNHEYLISVFASVLKQCKDAVLMLIGDGENRQDIEEQVKTLNRDLNVIFCGLVNHVNDYMQAMDVFVLPSRYEGLPIVGVEAQAAGLPVITSTNVSDELKITDAVTFLSLESGTEQWAQNILRYKNQARQDYSDQMKAQGYDIRSTAKEIEDLYLK